MNILEILIVGVAVSLACFDNCLTCWGEGSNECLLCAPHFIWENGVCSLLHEREIVGYGRECVECKQYNYVTTDYKCSPCPYQAKSCDVERDYECKSEKGFELDANNKCACVKGIFYQGKCICQEENTYPNGNGGCEDCVTKYLHLPYCENFKCPSHTYDNGEGCIQCHYSCEECNGPSEGNCLSCKSNFEFVAYINANICLCNCLMIEINEVCSCNDQTLDCMNLNLEIPPEEVNTTAGQHACSAGYQLFQGECLACRDPKILDSHGSCVCPENEVDFNGVCVLPCIDLNSYRINETTCVCKDSFDLYNGECIPSCSEYQIRNLQGECLCIKNYQFFGGQCLPCRDDKYFNSLGECVCPNNTVDWNDKCMPKCTSNNSHYNENNECECNIGYELLNGNCIEKCIENAERYLDGCKCRNGYSLINDKCVLNCQLNMHFNVNGECICDDGFESIGTTCAKKCKEYQVRNLRNNQCECIDQFEYIRNDDSCKLKCDTDGFEERNNKLNCECKEGYKRFHGKCKTKCTGLKDFDDLGNCVCPPNLVEHNNNCVKPCVGSHQHLATDDSCECDQNYEKFHDDCYVNCNEKQKRNSQGVCDCMDGYTKFNDKCKANCNSEREFDSVGNCKCKNNYVDYNELCHAPCVENAHFNGKMICECDAGFTLSAKKCISICSNNENYNSKTGKCQCNDGYMLDKKGKCSLR